MSLACVPASCPLVYLDLPGVGQGSSHTDPHSHEDGRQTCGQSGTGCEGLSLLSTTSRSSVHLLGHSPHPW